MNTLPAEITAYKVITDALEIVGCDHSIVELRDDGFHYCRDCGHYTPTVDEFQP